MRWRIVVWVVAGFALVYLLAIAGIFVLMSGPPERFARAIASMPQPLVFAALPFEPLWSVARAGRLAVGDPAPDFELQTTDRTARVHLSAFRGRMPVVLVFGSYT